MNDHADALIMKQTDYRESDVIVTVMTAEYGKISLIAAGARKMTSKNAGSILPYTKAEVQFDYKPGKTMFRLKTARTRALNRKIHEDLILSSAAAVLTEVMDALSLPGDESGNAAAEFALLDDGLRSLNDGRDPDLVLALYLAEMMSMFGIAPDADECVLCGSTVVTSVSTEDGGFLCAECAAKRGIAPRSVTELRKFRLIVKAGLSRYDLVSEAVTECRQELRDLVTILKIHTGIELRSFRLYERVFGIE